jgi:phage shock protein PspC (stress-responsive transcriptional regulator)
MQKVISINLNGNAYQLDESGYDALREYLTVAERELAINPDRAEILADLEQAIADKCQKFLGPHKSVVTSSEVDQIVKEMGPIEAASGDDAAGTGDSAAAGKETAQETRTEAGPRRLFRNPDGAMFGGVCNGLAAYFGLDVTIVRVVAVLIGIITKGVGIFFYVVMMFVIPEAHTAEERAASGGPPLNAQDVIDRAKKQYAEGTRQWRRQWRQQQRQWRRYGWAPGTPLVYGQPPWTAALLPVFALVHLALFLTMAVMMVSLVNTGAILSWPLPANVPVWAGVLILLIGYQVVVSPIRAIQHWSWQPPAGGQPGWYAFWNAVIWLMGMALVVWIASNHTPEIREFLQRLPPLIRQFAEAVRDLFAR